MEYVRQYFTDLQSTLDLMPIEEIRKVIQVLHEARIENRQLFIIGNGGSASTASHIVCDLAKNTRSEGFPSFRIMGLTDNSAIFSAYANDDGYENVFALQLASFVQENDVVLGISTSGNSPNILRAIEFANRAGAITISFTGFDGGRLQSLTKMNIHVPSFNIEQVEDVHLILGHLITTNLRNLSTNAIKALAHS